MKLNFTKKIANWGNFPWVEKEIRTADNTRDIRKLVLENNEIIARGNGRCYGDASLGEVMFSTKNLNKFIYFDRIKGIFECESGVLFSEILETILPQGYFLAITPGTKFISVGGAIASDIHGKNHHTDGCFSNCVISFEIMIENGDVKTCSREENSELFWASIGAMGLTGIILSAKFKLKPIESAYIRQESIKAKNLDEIFDLFDQSEGWAYNVAWIDCLQKGNHIGRSILMRGEHALVSDLKNENHKKKPLMLKKKASPSVPFFFPSFVLNTWSVKLFNLIYFKKQQSQKTSNIVGYETFFYPLDFILNWNKIYGKKGFIQYQMVIPKEQGKEGMKKILECIANSGQGSFLAVLKLFGKTNEMAYNSFPIEGYTLALDFKVNDRIRHLVHQLDEIVEKHNGRIYRTKDSMSRSSLTNYLQQTESSRFVSQQSKRIK